MADLFLQISVSLDGFIEGRDKNLDWMTHDPSFDPVATETLKAIDGMIFGATAHAVLAQFWPQAAAHPNPDPDLPELPEQARLMRDLPKYVLTRSGDMHGWDNSHAVSVDDVARLKADAARPIAVFAGARTAQALLPLIDEIRLIQYPILLGGGTRLFGERGPRRALKRSSTREFASGAVLTVDRFV